MNGASIQMSTLGHASEKRMLDRSQAGWGRLGGSLWLITDGRVPHPLRSKGWRITLARVGAPRLFFPTDRKGHRADARERRRYHDLNHSESARQLLKSASSRKMRLNPSSEMIFLSA